MEEQLRKGDRVATPFGNATVIYVRMAAPNYNTVQAVSVKLDSLPVSSNTGTILPVENVKKIK